MLPLTLNHRSRPEVLAAVNELFGGEFGDEFQRLEPAAGCRRPRASERRSSCSSPTRRRPPRPASTGAAPRRGTSRGACASSSTRALRRRARSSLLFAAGTDAEWFEEELRAVGLPTYRAAGRNYFGQQQVVDLLSYLRLLHNRYDDEALLDGARLAVRRRLERRARPDPGGGRSASRSSAASSARCPATSPDDDRRLLLRLPAALRAARSSVAAHASLELLCERILAEHDYDLAVLARHDGRRRYANLRKLARLARSYEELRGADLEGFVRFVEGQEAVGAKESDAVSEEEGADAVRLLTIHAAKGLEFEVVVVADAGREPSAGRPTSSRSPTGASASRSRIPRPARASAPARTRTSRSSASTRSRPSGSASTTSR